MALPQKVTAKVVSNIKLNNRVYELKLKYISPETLNFAPGQFISLQVAPNTFRSYSICSDYKNTQELDIVVSALHDGMGANYIKNLQEGDEVLFIGAAGRFKLVEPVYDNLMFYATGTGISPFLCFLHLLQDRQYMGNIKLYFGVRTAEELFYLEKLKAFEKSLKSFDYDIFLSSQGKRVTSVNQSEIIPDAQYYLCGHPQMIVDMKALLLSRGISENTIFEEEFTRKNA